MDIITGKHEISKYLQKLDSPTLSKQLSLLCFNYHFEAALLWLHSPHSKGWGECQ